MMMLDVVVNPPPPAPATTLATRNHCKLGATPHPNVPTVNKHKLLSSVPLLPKTSLNRPMSGLKQHKLNR